MDECSWACQQHQNLIGSVLIPSLNLHHDVRRVYSTMKTFPLDWHKLKHCERHNWPEIWVSIHYNMVLQKEAVSRITSFKLCNQSTPLVVYELIPGWRPFVHNHYRSDPFAKFPLGLQSIFHTTSPTSYLYPAPFPPSPPPPLSL